MMPFIYILIIIAWTLIILGFQYKDYLFGSLGSIFLLALGVYIALNGLTGINNLSTQTLAVVQIAVGAYIFIRGSYEIYKNM